MHYLSKLQSASHSSDYILGISFIIYKYARPRYSKDGFQELQIDLLVDHRCSNIPGGQTGNGSKGSGNSNLTLAGGVADVPSAKRGATGSKQLGRFVA